MLTTTLVYVSGPRIDLKKACDCANMLHSDGFYTHVPHLYSLENMISPRLEAEWLAQAIVILEKCHALYQLSGTSSVVEYEVKHAKSFGIPVFSEYRELLKFFREGSDG